MTSLKIALMAGCVALAASAGAARAASYSVSVSEGVTNGSSFSSQPGSAFVGGNTASATFTYTGPINFDNTSAQNAPPTGDLNSTFGFSGSNVSGYAGSGTVTYNTSQVANYSTLGNFLASSASASGYAYASEYAIDLGVLAAGTILTITHDDGVSVYQGANGYTTTTRGPTTRRTENVTLASAADTTLYYGRQNGTPSTLIVSVPEPVSLSLLGAGLVGLGLVRRRKTVAATAA